MRLALHIVRKDFLRLRGWLALWALLLAVKVCLGWLARSGMLISTDSGLNQLVQLLRLVSVLQGAITFLLALVLVQEDTLVGARQFWITRPISGRRLLAGKVLGAVLLLAGLPLLIALPWWLTCHFGVGELAWAATETVGMQLLIVLPAMLVASLTDSLSRALLWAFVLAMAAATVAIWANFFVFGRSGALEVPWMRGALALAALAVTAVAVMALQFFSRRLVRSLLALGAGGMLAAGIAVGWPARWAPLFSSGEFNAERGARVKLSFDGASFPPVRKDVHERDDAMSVNLTARGIPEGMLLMSADRADYAWRWKSGLEISRVGWLEYYPHPQYGQDEYEYVMRAALGLHEPSVDPETELALDAAWQKYRESEEAYRTTHGLPPLPEKRWRRPRPLKTDAEKLLGGAMIPRSLAMRMRTDPPAFEAKLPLRFLRPDVWFEFPLRADGWHNQGSHAMRVVYVHPTMVGANHRPERPFEAVFVSIVETSPVTWWEEWRRVYFPRRERDSELHEHLVGRIYVVTRALDRLEEVEAHRGENLQIRVCGVHVAWHSFEANAPRLSRAGQWVDAMPAWLDHAMLTMIGYGEEARFNRDVKVERFQLK